MCQIRFELKHFIQYNDGNKYIVFVGSGHASTYMGVSGIPDLLDIPHIIMCDLDEGHPNETLEHDCTYLFLHCDILYYRNPATKKTLSNKECDRPHLARLMGLTGSQLLELEIKLDSICHLPDFDQMSSHYLNELIHDPILGLAYTGILLDKYLDLFSSDYWAEVARISINRAKLVLNKKNIAALVLASIPRFNPQTQNHDMITLSVAITLNTIPEYLTQLETNKPLAYFFSLDRKLRRAKIYQFGLSNPHFSDEKKLLLIYALFASVTGSDFKRIYCRSFNTYFSKHSEFRGQRKDFLY